MIKNREKTEKRGYFKPVTLNSDLHIESNRSIISTPGVNVLAFIPGSDPKLKEEVIVLTAHYDHLGKRGDDIFHGADDNASGTAALIEIAEAFQEASEEGYRPRRSVLCLLVTGEEKGLLGSQYYTEHPLIPLEHTVANINLDMIGRIDDKHDDGNYIYVIGSDRLSKDLHDINERVNATYTNLDLDYTYNAPDDPNQYYYRSDHYSFAKRGIPAIFYFSGTHADYHKTSDTPDKIDSEKATRITRLAFHLAWELAWRDERIKVDVKD